MASFIALVFLISCQKADNKPIGDGHVFNLFEAEPLVAKELRKDPKLSIPFLSEMVDIAVRSDIGLALRFENYATSQTRHEMECIRKEFSADKFNTQEKQIASLKKEVGNLQSRVEDRDSLFSRLSELQKKFDQLTHTGEQKDQEIKELKSKLRLTDEQTVPVLIKNDLYSWDYNQDFGFRFIDEVTKKSWLFILGYGKTSVINLPPGDYMIEGVRDGETAATIKKAVTQKPSSYYEGKWYYCVVTALPKKGMLF
jgi:hypothetical protein